MSQHGILSRLSGAEYSVNHYHAFGMTIQTDLEFIELPPVDSNVAVVDLRILEAEDAFEFPNLDVELSVHEERRRFLFQVNGVADFLIEYGNRITYRREDGVGDEILRLYLLGSCLGCILQQRGYVVLHGNAVSVNGKDCKIIVGHTGAGKSTYAAWRFRQGDWILADDVCAVGQDDEGNPQVIPSFPQVKLWQTSADLLGIPTSGLRRIRSENDKYALPLGSQFYATPLVLTEVVELRANNETVESINGMDKSRCLIEHSYRYHFVKKMGLASDYGKKLLNLANRIQINTGVRPVISAIQNEPENHKVV